MSSKQNKDMSDIIQEWLEAGISFHTAKGYDISIRRMIKDKMIPNILNYSLNEFHKINHEQVVVAIKKRKDLTYHACENTASAYRSLGKYVKEHYPMPCCEHECKKDQ